MARHTGFIAFGLMFAAAAIYSFLPAGEPSKGPTASSTFETSPSSPPHDGILMQTTESSGTPQGSGFDFYVLALSWSPTFCDSEAAGSNHAQCGEDKDFGWVVHGLWPQNERGWPENCPTPGGARVPERIGQTVMDIMPGMGLIGHQWRKHGSCSGLSIGDYFNTVRQAFDRITLPREFDRPTTPAMTDPAAIEQAFIRSNPGLARSAVAVTCDRDKLDEVRICLDKSLAFRDCREVDANACRRKNVVVPPIR